MARYTKILLLSFVGLALSPTVARANAGTPLMWAGVFHLLFGNAIVGLVEGLILARWFRLRGTTCVALMIVANYFSAWMGGAFLIPRISASVSLDLYNAWRWLWCMVGISYLLTLLLEWPFVAFCLRRREAWFSKSVRASLVVQTASYLALFGWFWCVSGTSLYTEWAVVQPSRVSLPSGVTLYYLAENDGAVCVWNVGDGAPQRLCTFASLKNEDRLRLRESPTFPGTYLTVGPVDEGPSDAEGTVCAGVSCATAEPPYAPRFGGDVPKFRNDQSGWSFYFGWMAGGLSGNNAKDGRRVYVSLETPFAVWPVRSPTQLPSGQVVFQLGKNQICVLDPNERKIALLAKGRWPVVTLAR
jgi:hypothetical protein